MSVSAANGYQGGNSIGMNGGDFDQFIKCYNDTGAAVTEGDCYIVNFADGADGYYPTITAVATDSTSRNFLGVVTNDIHGAAGIPSNDWGWMQVRGYCSKINTTGSVTINHTLEVLNGVATASTEGAATLTANTFAIAKTAVTGAGSVDGVLLGDKVVIAAS